MTTFVVQTSQSLQPDYGRITSAILLELVALQRARSPEDVPSANVTLDTLAPSAGDVWVNALWFTTLGLSLSTVLVAVLVKQWLQVRIHVDRHHASFIPTIALGICQDTSRTPTRPRADTPPAL